ncbi:MAG: endonuclease III [Candidatus Aminicenantes bacterium]|nr:MAG: endonuclease III [Candidatus Aminicenantes bacterium]
MKSAKQRIGDIIEILRKNYPRSHTALKFETPLQIMVSTILSAQCTDARVNQVTPALFKKYRTAADFATADQGELEEEIRSTGFFRNKAKNIIGASKKIVEDFGGEVPDSMEELITLPGVARKTANIVLSSSFKKTEGIAVDTHVKRLSQRLSLSKEKDPDKVERDLMGIVPKEDWLDFNYMLVDHGRKICPARKPNCPLCNINHLCPSAEEFYSSSELNLDRK